MNRLQNLKPLLLHWLPPALTVFVILAGGVAWIKQGRNFWSTRDRRAQRMMASGDTQSAVDTFADPFRRGVAQFRGGDFKSASSTFAGLPDSDAAFNQATARIMLGQYETAVKLLDQVLAEQPDRQDAIINREIAAGRAERVKDEGGEMTGGNLGADEIVFNDTPSGDSGGDEVETEEARLSDEETRMMWLRQVETTPADFLKTKFAYQKAKQSDAIAQPDSPHSASVGGDP